ncbi:MAG: hypothetical protein ABIA67_03275 [Candidatus Margulisiibacteriota bacterium]
MAEEKTNKMLNKIEKLITGGNKEVLDRLDRVESRLGGVETGLNKLEDGQQKLAETLRKEIKQSYDFTSYDLNQAEKRLSDKIDKVDEKLEKHLKVPHAV